MGKIHEILDGFNNGTLRNEEEFCRLINKESSFITYKAYNNFKEIATKRLLKASDILSFQENLDKTIENYDDSVISEAEEWCFLPGNGQKEGCPCLINVARYINIIKDQNLVDQKLILEHEEKMRKAQEKYDRELAEFKANYINLNKQLETPTKIPSACLLTGWDRDPVSSNPDAETYPHPTEYCASTVGYYQWYIRYTDKYKKKTLDDFVLLNTPQKDTVDKITFPPKPEMQNQCCLNLITATDAAKVQNAKQLCQQTMINRKIIGDTDSLEAIEIAKREEEEAAAASDKKKKIFIILACVLLILGGVGIFLFISNGNAAVSTELKSSPSVNSTT